MSFFKAYKEEVEKSPGKSKKRDTTIDKERIEDVKKRLSILSDPQPILKTTKTSGNITQCLPDAPGNNTRCLPGDTPGNITQCLPDAPGNKKILPGVYPDNDRVNTGYYEEEQPLPDVYPVITRSLPGKKDEHEVRQDLSDAWKISHKFALVLAYIIVNKNRGVISKSEISKATGVKYDNIKAAYRKLISLGYIKPTISQNQKGSFIELNNLILCEKFSKERLSYIYDSNTRQFFREGFQPLPDVYPVITRSLPSESPGNDRVMTGQSYNSSSSYIYKTTTTARESFLDHPEMCFWEKQGVTSDMIQKNIEHHNIDPELFIQSMKYYAFEFSQPGSRQPEKTHLAHLIGGIRQFGMWAKPNGYVSHEEAEKKRLEAFIAEKRKELEELEALKLEASFFMFYEAYVKTPDSEEVKAVMEQASSFDLDNLRKKPDKKEAWLRTIWNKSRNMN